MVRFDCRFCHNQDPPPGIPVDPTYLPDRHHLLVGTSTEDSFLNSSINWFGPGLPNPDADGDGVNDATFNCLNCHTVEWNPDTNSYDVLVERSCLVCHVGSPHQNVVFNGGDSCSDCHNNENLNGSHLKHTDPDTILAGRTLSGGDFGNVTWWYQYSNTGGTPRAACGYCHPNTDATHINGITNLNFDPNEVGLPGGTLKGLNGSPPVFFQNTGVSVTCSSVYCHSTGYDDGSGFDYQTSPDWFGGEFIGDKCANCHGNSPNSGGKPGSLSHYNPDSYGMGIVGGHFVGIHYDNVYTGATGLIQDANSNNNAHGSAATSTTISCQVCHNGTVTTMANDQNTVCATCHGVGAIGLQGDMIIAAASTVHINGQPDVVFMPGNVRSKAQIRDDITTVTELNDNW
jgi:predicted CxxxxCH...CXXCH cytochrome family protein